jgi:hypothetical protein
MVKPIYTYIYIYIRITVLYIYIYTEINTNRKNWLWYQLCNEYEFTVSINTSMFHQLKHLIKPTLADIPPWPSRASQSVENKLQFWSMLNVQSTARTYRIGLDLG